MACRRSLVQARLASTIVAAWAAFALSESTYAVVKPRDILATVDSDPTANESLFPKPPLVRKQVRFWEKVFYKYPSTTVIVHETDDPDRIIDVIDYKAFAARDDKKVPASRKEREEVTTKYLKRYNQAVERFKKLGDDALKFGAIETRLYSVYRKNPEALKKLYAGEIKLRAQTGLADDFTNAAETAAAYLPFMEKVFHTYGVPTHVTRLPFVESMFNVRARSKVGASGIWQFMPATARNYVYVNALVDERNDPFKATRAAASFLAGNYRELKSWPLAITAYNHGVAGMAKAAKQLGTTDIAAIIQNFDSPSFGFASRNFYSEFLAAANTFEKLQRTGRITQKVKLSETESIILLKDVSVAMLLKHTPLTKEVLEQHNPCLLEPAYTTHVNKPLPDYYEIRVPRAMAKAVKVALQDLDGRRYAKR